MTSSLDETYNLVAIGNTGVGKSSLLNMFIGNPDAFKVGEYSSSETSLASHQFAQYENVKLKLIDTQGLSDGAGDTKDMIHIKNMVEKIRELEIVDLFLLCLDGFNPRLADYTKATINLFRQIFPDFLSHTVIVFNKWTWADQKKKELLRKDYQAKFENDYQHSNIPCYFIDSFYNLEMLRDNDDGTQSIKKLHPNIQERTKTQVKSLLAYLITKNTQCDVRNITPKNTRFADIKEQHYEVQNEIIDDKLLWEVSKYALIRGQFFGNSCSSSASGGIEGIEWRWRGTFKCPNFATHAGNSKGLKSERGAKEHAAYDFMMKCYQAKLLKRDSIENILGKPSTIKPLQTE